MRTKQAIVLSAVLGLIGISGAPVQAETVTVYSARNEQLIKPLFDA